MQCFCLNPKRTLYSIFKNNNVSLYQRWSLKPPLQMEIKTKTLLTFHKKGSFAQEWDPRSAHGLCPLAWQHTHLLNHASPYCWWSSKSHLLATSSSCLCPPTPISMEVACPLRISVNPIDRAHSAFPITFLF